MNQTSSTAVPEAPPSYHETVHDPSTSLSPENSTSKPQLEAADGLTSLSLEPPPAFTLTPLTLTVSHNSMLIESCTHNIRALYELTHPLSTLINSIGISEIRPASRLGNNGMFLDQKDKEDNMLWRVYENPSHPSSKYATVISDQRRRNGNWGRPASVVLRRNLWLAGKVWEAKSSKAGLCFSAQKEKRIVEWKDAKGTLVAVDISAADRITEAEKLEILVELGEEVMHLLVGCWIGRIHQGLQTEEEDDGREAGNKKLQ